MSTSVELLASRTIAVPSAAKPLDETVWRAWVAKGRAEDRRSSADSLTAVKWISSGALLCAAAFASLLAPYDVVVRFVVAAGAMIVTLQALHARHYAIAAGFGAFVVIYNPVAPVFNLSGDWQRAVVAASSLPFLASLSWPTSDEARRGGART